MTAHYLYFKPRGKWKYEGWGVSIPIDGLRLTHDRIRELNGGIMPGINNHGKDLVVVILDPESYPRMVLNEIAW